MNTSLWTSTVLGTRGRVSPCDGRKDGTGLGGGSCCGKYKGSGCAGICLATRPIINLYVTDYSQNRMNTSSPNTFSGAVF